LFSKSPSLNSIHHELAVIPRACSNSPINFSFDLNEFSVNVFQIFNNFSIACQNILKPTQCNPTHGGLSNCTKSMIRGAMVQDKQTNNLPS
jgi:hypothetical protein